MPKKPIDEKIIHRSAKTGEFVTEKYAKSHPATTVTEHRKIVPPNNKGKK